MRHATCWSSSLYFIIGYKYPITKAVSGCAGANHQATTILNGSEHFELDIAKFGLLPSWAKELRFSSHTYNARIETVSEKPSFRHAWKYSKFCLVPVQEFYEPKYIDGKPHWYAIKRADDQPFSVAGIYDDAVIDGDKVRSFLMLTINSDHPPS